MKKYYYLFRLCLLVLFTATLMSYITGSPGEKTNAPIEGSCGEIDCHTQSAEPMDSIISTNIPETGYLPDSTYDIVVTGKVENINRYGFELACFTKNNTLLNGLSSDDELNIFSASRRATHKFEHIDGQGMKVWNLKWKAPSKGTGEVTFYVSLIASNADSTNSGDLLYKDSYTVQEVQTSSLSDLQLSKLTVYPNPSQDFVRIEGSIPPNATLELFDVSGTLIRTVVGNREMQIKDLSPATYILKISSGNQTVSKRIQKF